jgi:hypothetical protein
MSFSSAWNGGCFFPCPLNSQFPVLNYALCYFTSLVPMTCNKTILILHTLSLHSKVMVKLLCLEPPPPPPPPPLPRVAQQPHCWGFDITCRHTTFDRTPLNEGSPCRKDLNLTKNDIEKKHTSMTPTEFEPEFPANQRRQTKPKDRADTGIGISWSEQFSLDYYCIWV